MTSLTPFTATRLSKHFLLFDFLHGHTLYSAARPLPPKDIHPTQIRTGQRLCEELLEPLIAEFGPCSISNGLIPKDLLSSRATPHTWNPTDGAAADVIFHDWVNAERAPIKLVERIIERGLPFERLITYAGSEVICMSAGRSPKNRGAVYENVRRPGSSRPEFVTWSRGGKLPTLPLMERPDWRRTDDEMPYHTQRNLRAQHLRVSRYFTALDFCRNEPALEAGRPWVPAFRKVAALDAARCMGEVLDTVVAQVGRISITRGITRPGDGVLDNHTWDGESFSVEFALPLGADTPSVDHPAVTAVTWREAPGGTPRATLTVKRFRPAVSWSSAVQPVANRLTKSL